jgi:hypothetical protein
MTATTTEPPLDRAVIDAAIELIETPDIWTQGAYESDGRVCAHGAVLRQHCTPGDQHMWRQVMRVRGLTEQWNDRPGRTPGEVAAKFREVAEATEDDMAAVFGRNWRSIRALVRRLAVLDDDEIFQIDAAWSYHYESRAPMSGSRPAEAVDEVVCAALDGQPFDALAAARDAALAAYMGVEFATTETIGALCAPIRAVWPEFMTDAWLAEVQP